MNRTTLTKFLGESPSRGNPRHAKWARCLVCIWHRFRFVSVADHLFLSTTFRTLHTTPHDVHDTEHDINGDV